VSRITGLVREQMVAAMFGASAMTDAFNVAFRIPEPAAPPVCRGRVLAGLRAAAGHHACRDGDEATQALIDAAATLLAWALLVTCVARHRGSPALVWLLALGHGERRPTRPPSR
jgi:putative peptidoglycan lipid II flippase